MARSEIAGGGRIAMSMAITSLIAMARAEQAEIAGKGDHAGIVSISVLAHSPETQTSFPQQRDQPRSRCDCLMLIPARRRLIAVVDDDDVASARAFRQPRDDAVRGAMAEPVPIPAGPAPADQA